MNWEHELKELHQWCLSLRKKKSSLEGKIEKFFQMECKRFLNMFSNYSLKYEEMYSSAITRITRKEYSKNGAFLVRGYYCPSPILDIVTGNYKRGKLLKKATCITNPDYEYCFDERNNLILVNSLHSSQVEVLEYTGNTVLGITFLKDRDNEINSIIECMYDSEGRIISFVLSYGSSVECKVDEIHKEVYLYEQQGLSEVEVYDFLDDKEYPHLTHEIYHFEHDEHGYLKEYRCNSPTGTRDNLYKVRIKRKV